ncbi:unnamed protein product [Prorocentrum cordatum]|uniref:Uncharacterized protein n=1 Tax=Prorocentrum cordatum TaxID=2364126 RepID=A0ABN9Q7A4_9DINO|nr:unnamed protein product [Polarella glacialis]
MALSLARSVCAVWSRSCLALSSSRTVVFASEYSFSPNSSIVFLKSAALVVKNAPMASGKFLAASFLRSDGMSASSPPRARRNAFDLPTASSNSFFDFFLAAFCGFSLASSSSFCSLSSRFRVFSSALLCDVGVGAGLEAAWPSDAAAMSTISLLYLYSFTPRSARAFILRGLASSVISASLSGASPISAGNSILTLDLALAVGVLTGASSGASSSGSSFGCIRVSCGSFGESCTACLISSCCMRAASSAPCFSMALRASIATSSASSAPRDGPVEQSVANCSTSDVGPNASNLLSTYGRGAYSGFAAWRNSSKLDTMKWQNSTWYSTMLSASALAEIEALSRQLKVAFFRGAEGPDKAQKAERDQAAVDKLQQWCVDSLKLVKPPSDPLSAPKVLGSVSNFMEDAAMLEWAGVGFGKQESFHVAMSLRKLAADLPSLEKLRIWGKILGTGGDYYVAEGTLQAVSDKPEPDPLPNAPEGRVGAGRRGGERRVLLGVGRWRGSLGPLTRSACEPHRQRSLHQAAVHGQPRERGTLHALVPRQGAAPAAVADRPHHSYMHAGTVWLLRGGRGVGGEEQAERGRGVRVP